jgi:hypothetical protein
MAQYVLNLAKRLAAALKQVNTLPARTATTPACLAEPDRPPSNA